MSTAIASHQYDPESQTLTVQFHNGGTYRYHRVPPHKARELENASSKGTYFRDHVLSKHPFNRLK